VAVVSQVVVVMLFEALRRNEVIPKIRLFDQVWWLSVAIEEGLAFGNQ